MNVASLRPSSPEVSRRTVVAGAAWAVPAIVTVGATPALAASGGPAMTTSTPNGQAPAAGDVPVTATIKPASSAVAAATGADLSGRAVTFTGPSGVSFSPATSTTNASGVATTTMTTTDTWAMPGSTISITAVSEGVQPGSSAVTVVGANAYALGHNADSERIGAIGAEPEKEFLDRPAQLPLAFSSVFAVTG